MKKKEASHKNDNSPDDSPHDCALSHVTAKVEKEYIIKILKTTDGNKTRAAEILGISRKTLWEKLKSHNIEL